MDRERRAIASKASHAVLMNVTISATLIVKNEERHLAQCLDSIASLANEIIIVDTGSEDQTLAIARQYTDKIFHFEWCDDYGLARTEALKYATQDWILIINGDEKLDAQAPLAIKNHLNALSPENPCILLFHLFTPEQPALFVRGLFPNHQGIYFKGRVHEFPVHPKRELMSLECPDIVVHHRPLYPSNKYEYDKRLLLLDLKAFEDDFERALHLLHLGRTELRLNNLQMAFDAFHQALFHYYRSGATPDKRLHLNLLQYLSELSLKLGKIQEASQYSLKLTQVFPKFADGWLSLAHVLLWQGDLNQAEKHFLTAFEQSKNVKDKHAQDIVLVAQFGLARIAVLNKDFAKGIQIFHSLHQQRTSSEIELHLARAYFLTQNETLARLWLAKHFSPKKDLKKNLQSFDIWTQEEMLQLRNNFVD